MTMDNSKFLLPNDVEDFVPKLIAYSNNIRDLMLKSVTAELVELDVIAPRGEVQSLEHLIAVLTVTRKGKAFVNSGEPLPAALRVLLGVVSNKEIWEDTIPVLFLMGLDEREASEWMANLYESPDAVVSDIKQYSDWLKDAMR